jgi:hypothetical protein
MMNDETRQKHALRTALSERLTAEVGDDVLRLAAQDDEGNDIASIDVSPDEFRALLYATLSPQVLEVLKLIQNAERAQAIVVVPRETPDFKLPEGAFMSPGNGKAH